MGRLAPRCVYSVIRQAAYITPMKSIMGAPRALVSEGTQPRKLALLQSHARHSYSSHSHDYRLKPTIHLPFRTQLGARWPEASSAEVKAVHPSLRTPQINKKELPLSNCCGSMIESSQSFLRPSCLPWGARGTRGLCPLPLTVLPSARIAPSTSTSLWGLCQYRHAGEMSYLHRKL